MSYKSIVQMADSYNLWHRLKACAATQTSTTIQSYTDRCVSALDQPNSRWILAGSPGWAAAWDSAVTSNNPDPGGDPTVITDAMILAAVQPYLTARVT